MIHTIGIIGGGQMGSGIAQVCVTSGYSVWLNDIDQKQLDQAVQSIQTSTQKSVEKGKMTSEKRLKAIANLNTTECYQKLHNCDLVIEAATENESLKIKIFSQILPYLKKEALLASNTSSLSITRLAAATDRPERFIGMHFMNPVPVMKLVEVIRGLATSQDTYEAICQVIENLDKEFAVSQDFPGFIVNRILIPMINEAIFCLHENVGTVMAIDQAMTLGANMPMGPLKLADLIGLDTCLSIMQVLYKDFSDDKYRPCPLLAKYVEAGWLGRKSQRGFYDYSSQSETST